MRPSSVVLAGHVPAPVDHIFSLLTDPARIPDWLPACHSAATAGPLEKGSRLQVRFGTRETEFEIVDFSAPNTFGWVERGARHGHKTFFHLGFAGGSTAITMKNVWQPTGPKAWLLGKLRRRRSAQRTFDGLLNNLRSIVTR